MPPHGGRTRTDITPPQSLCSLAAGIARAQRHAPHDRPHLDAVTVAKTLTKEVLIWKLRVVDERSTYSIITAIFKLWDDGNYGLFTIVFGFSIVFPIAKLLANTVLVLSTFRPSMDTGHHPRIAAWLGYLGKWSMIEVFMAALLCVVVKMGDLVRVQIEPGLYVFCAAVLTSIICASATRQYCISHHP